MAAYFESLCAAMKRLSDIPNSVFLGQSVLYPGTAMFNTLRDVPMEKRVELPVAEDMEMGMAIGIALQGGLPICLYPRMNFLLLATNQLVLHLDKLSLYSRGGYKPKVIIRTSIATDQPLNPQHQHLGDFTTGLGMMLQTTFVYSLDDPYDVEVKYRDAMSHDAPALLIEHARLYNF